MHKFLQWKEASQAYIREALERFLPSETIAPARLHEAMRYAVLGGGKRLRPMLVMAAAALGSPSSEATARAVAAVEYVHAYSLVHDDLPLMDNDPLRHGLPACHVAFGAADALLVGDGLQSLAFAVLSQPCGLSAPRQLRMLALLAEAVGSLGMVGGQAIDLASVGVHLTQQELETMHRLKTGALIRAAVGLGALCCPDLSDATLDVVDRYAQHLGLAFQVIDDVLDCEQDTRTLGKTAGKDQQQGKPTYVTLLGLPLARSYAVTLIDQALAQLDELDESADYLRALARFVVERAH